MARTTEMREVLALAWSGAIGRVSLHSGDPGTTGANELSTSGGSPAYARRTPTWTAGTTDGQVVSDQMDFDVPGSSGTPIGVTHIGFRKTDGTFMDSYALPSTQTFSSQGHLLVTVTATGQA